jgi:hypothetical protein
LKVPDGQIKELIGRVKSFPDNEGDLDFVANVAEVDLRFVKKIKFDTNNRFLVGFGENKIFVLNLKTKEHEILENNSRRYEKICDLNLISHSDKNKGYKCFISTLRKDVK